MGSSSDFETYEALLESVPRLNRNLCYFHYSAQSIMSTSRVAWDPLQKLNHRSMKLVEKVTLDIYLLKQIFRIITFLSFKSIDLIVLVKQASALLPKDL